MTKEEILEFFDTIEKLEKHGAVVDVEFDIEHDEFINSIASKKYSNLDRDVYDGFVSYSIDTNSRI